MTTSIMQTVTVLDETAVLAQYDAIIANAIQTSDDLTSIAVSCVINYWNYQYNTALSGHIINKCNADNIGTAKVRKMTNAVKAWIVLFTAIQAKKDKDTGELAKNKDGVIYQKNSTKAEKMVAEAATEGYSSEEMVAYIATKMEARLAELGGSIMGEAKPKVKTEEEKKADKLSRFSRSACAVMKTHTIFEIMDALEKAGIMDSIKALQGAQESDK